MKTISFYSYKGGVGRSLLVANFARYLARFDQTVVVIDLDLEAPGLHHKLHVSDKGESLPITRGVADFLDEYRERGAPDHPIRDYALRLDGEDPRGRLWLIPAGDVASREYWRRLGRLNWHEFFYGESHSGVEAFLELKRRIEEELKPDYLLIDSRTGITEVGGIATNLLPDAVVCLMLANRENMEGMRVVLESLAQRHEVFGGDPVQIVPVLSRRLSDEEILMPDGEEEEERVRWVEQQIEQALVLAPTWSEEVLVMHQDNAVHCRERVLVGSSERPSDSELLRDYLSLFRHLVPTEVISASLPELLKRAKEEIFSNPDDVVRELENLADYTESPLAIRELALVYELRRYDSRRMIPAVMRLWETSGVVDDPIHYRVVKNDFESYWQSHAPPVARRIHNRTRHSGSVPAASRERHLGRGRSAESNTLLEYVNAVWSSHEPADAELGLQLARALHDVDQRERSLEVLLSLRSSDPDDPRLAEHLIRAFRAVGAYDEALSVFRELPEAARQDSKLVAERLLLAGDRGESLDELLEEEGIALPEALKLAPTAIAPLLISAGRAEEAIEIIVEHLAHVQRRHMDAEQQRELYGIVSTVSSEGLEPELGAALSSALDPRRREELLMWLDRFGFRGSELARVLAGSRDRAGT